MAILVPLIFAFTTLVIGLIFYIQRFDANIRARIVHTKSGVSIPGFSLLEAAFIALTSHDHPAVRQEKAVKRFGPIFLSWFGFTPRVIITDPIAAAKVLNNVKQYPKWEFMRLSPNSVIGRFLGDNVVSLNGERWAHQRAIMNPAFANNEVFFADMLTKVDTCMDKLAATAAVPLCVHELMQQMTIDVLARSVFGFDFHSMSGAMKGPLENYNFVVSNMLNPARFLLPKYDLWPTPTNLKLKGALEKYHEFVTGLIERARAIPTDKGQCLLQMLVNAQNEDGKPALTDKEIHHNTTIFLLAGHETTSVSLQFALYNLSKFSEVQDKAREEVLRVVGQREPTYADLSQLEYLGAVIKEVMRMHPPVGMLPGRIQAVEEDQVVCDYLIPKGTQVAALVLAMHHSEALWGADALRFRPERFLEKDSDIKRPLAAYMPFGWGARTCVGNNFSLQEQKIFLIRLLQRFEVQLKPGATLRLRGSMIVPGPDDSLELSFIPRI